MGGRGGERGGIEGEVGIDAVRKVQGRKEKEGKERE